MAVTLNIILEEISCYNTESHVSHESNPSFRLCLPLPDDNSPLRTDCLYIGSLSAALKCTQKQGAIIVCHRDRLADEAEAGAASENLIIVNENISRDALLSKVQNRFFAVLDWERRLRDALLHGCSMQELVDLCPPLLENHIQITDASFVKLAQSSAIECDCPICVALKEYGYHPEETVAKFRNYSLFDTWARANEIYYDPETVVAKYPTLHKIFKFHGIYYAHAVMSCNIKPVSDAMLDLFRIFSDVLSLCVERDWETKQSCVHPYDSVLQDLFDGRTHDSRHSEKRATYAGLPMTGAFYVLQIVRDKAQNAPFGTMMKEFSECFPRFKFINFQDSIAAIINISPRAETTLQEILSEFPAYLEKHNSFCGVSSCFQKITDTNHYFRQAQLSLKYGRGLYQSYVYDTMLSPLPSKNCRVFCFDDYFPLCFFGNEEDLPSLWQHSTYCRKLEKLYKNDKQRGSDDLRLLFVYLMNERRITATANILNMHRNSVIYRINRIEEFLGIDLSDDTTRLMFLFSLAPVSFFGFEA